MGKKGREGRSKTDAGRGAGGDAQPASRRPPPAAESDPAPNIPKWLPPTLFVGLTVMLFRDFIFSDQMLYGGDTLGLGYAVRDWYADAMAQLGRFPRWQPVILGGTPFLEALSAGDSFYPPSLLLLALMETYRALGWKLLLHVAAAGFFAFGWARAIGASRAAALVAGSGYMLTPYFISLAYAGHDGKLFVTALAPLLFMVVERHFVRPRLASFTHIAMVVALVLYTTHFQMAYFLFGATGMYAIFRAVQLWPEAKGRRLALFLAASVVGAGVAGFQFFPAVDYVTQASRRVATTRTEAGEVGTRWSSSWSLHQEEAMAMVIPEFAGNAASGWGHGPYWGRNTFKNNHEYAGLLLMLLAAVSFVGGARRGLRYFFLGLGALAFLFALGAHTPVWRIFYEVVPGIRLFRAPSQVMFLFALSAATLAALGFDRLLQRDDDSARRVRWVLTGAAGLLLLLGLAAASGGLTSIWTTVVRPDMEEYYLQALETVTPAIVRGAWIAFLLGAGLAGLAWAYQRGLLAPAGLLAGVVLLVVVDETRVSSSFVVTMDPAPLTTPNANIQAVLDREANSREPYRLLSMRGKGQDIDPSMFGIELAAGHHPNDLARYRELIGMVGSEQPWNLYENGSVRRLLNVRYVLYPDYELGRPYDGPNIVQRLQFADGQPYETMIAEDGLPRARLVGRAVVKSDAEAVPYMLSGAFDPEREVVLAEAPPTALPDTAVQGSVSWLARGPDRIRLRVQASQPALLVVANNWYPDWHATVDGADAPVLRAYHTLQAIPVPSGSSEVELWYASGVVRGSLWISLLLLVGLLTANGLVWWRAREATEPAP